MAGSKSNFMEDLVLDSILGKSDTHLSTGNPAAGVGTTVYVSLYNTTINDTVDALTDECSGSTYARVAVANTSANWTNSTAGSKQNKTVIQFTTAAGSDWGVVKAFAILTTNTTTVGEAIYYGDLTVNQTISSGNVVRFSTAAVVITED